MSPSRATLTGASAVLLAVLASLISPSTSCAQSATDKAAKAVERAADKTSKAADKLRSILDRKRKGGADSSAAVSGGAVAPAGGAGRAAAPPGAPAAGQQAAAATGGGGGVPRSMGVLRGSAKVEEIVVAPNENGITYAVTDRGGHFAAVVPKGSRFVAMYDGVAGPEFDRLLQPSNGRSFSFSPDGSRFAYIGDTGSEYVYMVDGKPTVKIPATGQSGVTPTMQVLFSPSGKHWLGHFASQSDQPGDPNPSRAWWDGIPGPALARPDFTLSPDGEHHTYTVLSRVNGGNELHVDGKPAAALGGSPIFSADGKLLFTTRAVPIQQGLPTEELLANGRVIARANNVWVHVPPVGDRIVVVVARTETAGSYQKMALVVGGKVIPGSESNGFPFITFSPDGKRFAAISGQKGGRQRVAIDGIPGRTYDRIDSLWFTPDSRHVVYLGVAASKQFVVIDSTESATGFAVGGPLVPSFTKEGRVGWMASTGQTNAVVVDGKVTPLNPRVGSFDFSFSPDGKRFAYASGGDVTGQLGGTVHIDHLPGPSSTLRDFEQLRSGDPIRYIWSPDSRYTVNYGYPGKSYGTDFGFIVGDRYLPVGNFPRVALPTFTPDGKHFFWLGYDGRTQDRQVWLDGRVVYEFDQQGEQPLKTTGGWLMGEDGTLTFFIQTADGFKRVRVTPGPENGFEGWLAKGKSLR